MVKRFNFFFSKLLQVLNKWNFSHGQIVFNLACIQDIQSENEKIQNTPKSACAMVTVCLLCTMDKAWFLCYLRSLFIT